MLYTMSINHRTIVSLAVTCCLVTFAKGICTFFNGELVCITNDSINPNWNIVDQLRQSALAVPLTEIRSVRIINNSTDEPSNSESTLQLSDNGFSGLSNLEQLHLLGFALLPVTKALNDISKSVKLLNLTRTNGQSLFKYVKSNNTFPELMEAYLHGAFLADTKIEISLWARAAPKLNKLSLRHNKICQLSGDSQENGKMQYLEYLDLHDNRCGKGLETNLALNFLAYFPRLHYLDMSATELEGRHLDQWADQANLIRTLNIAECKNIRSLSKEQFRSFNNLKNLNVSNNDDLILLPEYAFAGIHLETLDLSRISNMRLGGANLFANMTVKNLDLSLGTPTSPTGPVSLSFWQYDFLAPIRQGLIVLNVSGRTLPTGTVLSLDNFSSLEILKLSRMNLKSDSLKIASNNSAAIDKLRVVDLSGNDLTAFSNETGATFERFWRKDSKLQKLLLHDNPKLQCRACGNSYLMRWIANDSECRERAKSVLCRGITGSANADCPVCVDGTVVKKTDEFSVRDFASCGGGNCRVDKSTSGSNKGLSSLVYIAYVVISTFVLFH